MAEETQQTQTQETPREMSQSDLRATLQTAAWGANTMILSLADLAVDFSAKKGFGYEIDEIETSPKDRQKLDTALAACLDYYLRDRIGPLIAYLLVASSVFQNRYSFSAVSTESDKEQEDESTSKPDADNGQTGPRKKHPTQDNGTGTVKKPKRGRKSKAVPALATDNIA